MSELQSTLDDVLAVELHDLSDAGVLDRLGDLVCARNRIDAALAGTARHAELTQAVERDGLKSVRSWLVGHVLVSRPEAGRIVAAGRTLEKLPLLGDVASEGDVTAGKVVEAGKVVTPKNLAAADAAGVEMSSIDAALAVTGASQTHQKFTEVVQRVLAGLDPDGPEPDPTEDRGFTVITHADGSVSFSGHLDPVGGEKLKIATESVVQANRPAGDTRSRSRRQADALVQIMDNQLAAGNLPVLRTEKPHLIVSIDLDDLIAPSTGKGAGSTGLGQLISAARARWLACDAVVSRIVMGPDGAPLDLGRTHRVVTAALRRAVVARDTTCVFAGCDAPHWWCDVHHLIHWIDGGETSLTNSGLLCEAHHTQVHHGFDITRDDTDGRWHTYRPDGTEILIGPRLTDPVPPEPPPPPPRQAQDPSIRDIDQLLPEPAR